MSYDLLVFRTRPGRDPEEVYEEESELEEEGGAAAEPADDPLLDEYDERIEAAIEGSGTCCRSAGHIMINLSYGIDEAQMRAAFSKLAAVLAEAAGQGEKGGFTIYDLQLDRAIDPQADLEAMLESAEHTRARLRELGIPPGSSAGSKANAPAPGSPDPPAPQPRRPWWRFW
jgi:hypothetical protein